MGRGAALRDTSCVYHVASILAYEGFTAAVVRGSGFRADVLAGLSGSGFTAALTVRTATLDGRELYAAASIGISLGYARTHDPDGLLREADTAMYRAKEGGGGFRVFDPTMYDRALGRLEAENDLRRAIERDEFVVHYQPIVDLQSGGLWGMEALVR
jgi:predicted signal transduction protein with EAL and GGDEF domain